MPPDPEHGSPTVITDTLMPDAIFVSRQKQVHHEMNDITRREVFAGVFIEGFVELPDQLLEDCPHRRVIDDIRVEVHVLEALQDLKQQPGFVELADRVIEIEFLQNFLHIRAEALM